MRISFFSKPSVQRPPDVRAAATTAPMPASQAQESRQCSAFQSCARPDVAAKLHDRYSDLGGWPAPDKLPVVYSPAYNIGFWGLERLHPFDSKKYQHILGILEQAGVLRQAQLVQAVEAGHSVLREVHTEEYLNKLFSSPLAVAMVTELAPLAFMPAFLLRRKVLRPMACMAGGSMLAAALAVERGWAVNLGGGMHHAAHDQGGGWCAFADVTLAARRLRSASGGALSKVMIVDLDVHQGNGFERCKLHFKDDDTFVVDVYNGQIYPLDTTAKQAINVRRELPSGTGDEAYLAAVQGALQEAFEAFQPQLVIYNAGTDILQGDPLGRFQVSAEAVKQRDEMVWQAALEHEAPIVMLLSGGYTCASTPCIAASMQNLFSRFALGQAAH